MIWSRSPNRTKLRNELPWASREVPQTLYPLLSKSWARYAPSCPPMPQINAVFIERVRISSFLLNVPHRSAKVTSVHIYKVGSTLATYLIVEGRQSFAIAATRSHHIYVTPRLCHVCLVRLCLLHFKSPLWPRPPGLGCPRRLRLSHCEHVNRTHVHSSSNHH